MAANRFNHICRAIVDREPMSPPPHFEISVGHDVREAYLGRTTQTVQDDVDFWDQAGFCLYPVNIGLIPFGGTMVTAGSSIGRAHYSVYKDEDVEIAWAETGRGIICSEEDFERFTWADLENMTFSMLDEVAPILPHGMRIMVGIGKVFTGTWQLMGFIHFAESLHDSPELVERVMMRVAAIQHRITEKMIEHPDVGAVLHADDLAYFSGPMINPEVYRRNVFPTYKDLGELCRKKYLLYLFHSDGQITDLIPDIIGCGFIGLHPLEPKPMDAALVKDKLGDSICLLGHIDVDLLARGTSQQIRNQTRRCLDQLARDGGYCPGSANSVPDYIPLDNFLAMSEAINAWK